ncbi:MAG: hypothetical protein Q7T62_17265 [Undibacterium sp.]|nr:hypothetical protein [Undibacterium sp.]
MNKIDIIAKLHDNLHTLMAERRLVIDNPGMAAARMVLRQFQATRLAETHADLLTSKETRAAAQFFLDELYGTKDFTQRDADIERIVPMIEHLLPVSALHYIAEAIELDALSESLDGVMANHLGEHFTKDEYAIAYRAVGRRADREKQINHVNSVGHSLCELVHFPLIGITLTAMRSPAKLAKLSELHHFLEQGYAAFKKMKRPEDFVSTIVTRETVILKNLFTGNANPFQLLSE